VCRPGSKFKTMETSSCHNIWLKYVYLFIFLGFVLFCCWCCCCFCFLFVSFTAFYRIQYRILKNIGALIIELLNILDFFLSWRLNYWTLDIMELRILTYIERVIFYFEFWRILDFEVSFNWKYWTLNLVVIM
jgi:hypothetical protein